MEAWKGDHASGPPAHVFRIEHKADGLLSVLEPGLAMPCFERQSCLDITLKDTPDDPGTAPSQSPHASLPVQALRSSTNVPTSQQAAQGGCGRTGTHLHPCDPVDSRRSTRLDRDPVRPSKSTRPTAPGELGLVSLGQREPGESPNNIPVRRGRRFRAGRIWETQNLNSASTVSPSHGLVKLC